MGFWRSNEEEEERKEEKTERPSKIADKASLRALTLIELVVFWVVHRVRIDWSNPVQEVQIRPNQFQYP